MKSKTHAAILIKLSIFSFIVLGSPAISMARNYIDSAGAPPPKPVSKIIKVTDVYKWGHAEKNDPERNAAGIGDIITVKVYNLKLLLNRANCVDSAGNPIAGCKNQQIRLFLDGRMIKNISPESGAPQQDEGELQFHLERNADNDEIWADLLGAPMRGKFFKRPTKVSVGLENEYAENSDVDKFNLTRVRKFWFWACVLGSMVYLIVIVALARKTNLLRDREVDASSLGFPKPDGLQPFSLGRFQMAFWFSIVIAAFILIWLITGDYDIITPGVLALIGISAGTSLSAIVIDSSKGDQMIQDTLAMQKEEASLKAEIASPEVQNSPGTLGEKQSRLTQVQADIAKNKKSLTTNTSLGFLKDIVSDINGVSFHRLQMFVWTIVLGLLFVYSVWVRLAMPEFSATLLGLQGITAGTYLGFKIPEKQA